jgi:hypothetical protein
MADSGQLVNKQQIINDFIERVINPAWLRTSIYGESLIYANHWYGGDEPRVPTYDYQRGAYDSLNYVGNYAVIDQTALTAPVDGNIPSPSVAELSTEVITASNIVQVLRNYAYRSSRIRVVRAGIYYSDSTGIANNVITGTYAEQTNKAWLRDAYLRSEPLNVSGPVANNTIIASQLTNFYDSLRSAANTDTYADIIDLRICHTSCHASCHASRGRR